MRRAGMAGLAGQDPPAEVERGDKEVQGLTASRRSPPQHPDARKQHCRFCLDGFVILVPQ